MYYKFICLLGLILVLVVIKPAAANENFAGHWFGQDNNEQFELILLQNGDNIKGYHLNRIGDDWRVEESPSNHKPTIEGLIKGNEAIVHVESSHAHASLEAKLLFKDKSLFWQITKNVNGSCLPQEIMMDRVYDKKSFLGRSKFNCNSNYKTNFQGKWVLTNPKKGSLFDLYLYQKGNQIYGYHSSATNNGSKLEQTIKGEIKGNCAFVTIESIYLNTYGRAQLIIDLLDNKRLTWKIVDPPPPTKSNKTYDMDYYFPDQAKMKLENRSFKLGF
jgi:hypothetical protein